MTSLKTKMILLLVVTLFSSACTQHNFSEQLAKPIDSAGDTPVVCVPGEGSMTVPTKFLFVVDQSGSNLTGPAEYPGKATDKDKSLRYNAIREFFEEHQNKSYLRWGFISFQGIDADSFVMDTLSNPAFGTTSEMITALEVFRATKDSGATPYKAAIRMIYDLLQEDLKKAPTDMQYRIAFLTDGYPTDYCPSEGSCIGKIQDAQIMLDVQSVISLSPQRIQFSSVYYGHKDKQAALRLQNMAKVGKGQFVDTNVTSHISLDDVIQVPKKVCPQ